MGRGSTGPAIDRVFGLIGPHFAEHNLLVRPDPNAPALHAFVEPRVRMMLPVYEAALTSTRKDWEQIWP